ncbi:MAG: sigma-70 family RNA polymerase sigma factor [Planctomycetaceae bacterium]|nr:MAG: sigma-70 family RNA polymerase sigma factor [Planctomycetaceae bacterium]
MLMTRRGKRTAAVHTYGSAVFTIKAGLPMGQKEHSSYGHDAKKDSKSPTGETPTPEPGGNGKDRANPDPSDSLEFQQFVNQCMRQIETLIYWKYPGLDVAEKEDVFQEVILALWKRKEKNGHPFWLELESCRCLERKIAENKCNDILRREASEKRKREGKHQRIRASFSVWEPLPAWKQKEIQAICLRTASNLTEEDRWLWEQYVEHYPRSRRGKHLAEVTGLPYSSQEMKRRIAKIRKRFQIDLRDGGYDLDQIARE